MSNDVRFERLLADVLAERAPTREPNQLVPDIVIAASRARRRPRWLALMREHPMRLHAQVVVGSPNARIASLLVLPLLLALLAVGAVVGASLLSPTPRIPPEHGAFSSTGSLVQARWAHTATLLADGRVLVLGGATVNDLLGSSEVWDPAEGSFSLAASLGAKRSSHTATLLRDGRILVVGGHGDTAPLGSAELWNPASGSFAWTGSLAEARTSHTATLLRDGRVLVVGGWNYVGEGGAGRVVSVGTAEVWDPTSGSFSPAGSLFESRQGHTATLLADGRVLIVGGASEGAGLPISAELWDPRSDSFSLATPLADARSGHTATLLPDGRVLVVGGVNAGLGALDSAEVWNPATETFGPTGSLGEARYGHTTTLLPDGGILVVGGGVPARNKFTCPGVCIASAEIWVSTEESFSGTGSLAEARISHTATLLPTGRVLVVGGGLLDAVVGSAEVYDPIAQRSSPNSVPTPTTGPSPTMRPSPTTAPSPLPTFKPLADRSGCCLGNPNYLPGFGYRLPAGWTHVADTMHSEVFVRSTGLAAGTVALHWAAAFATNDRGCAGVVASGVGTTAAEMVAALKSDPRLVASSAQPVSIAGYSGLTLDLQLDPNWTGTCNWSGGKPAALLLTAGAEQVGPFFGITGSERVRGFILDVYTGSETEGDQNVVAWLGITADGSSFDAVLSEAMPLVDSFAFHP